MTVSHCQQIHRSSTALRPFAISDIPRSRLAYMLSRAKSRNVGTSNHGLTPSIGSRKGTKSSSYISPRRTSRCTVVLVVGSVLVLLFYWFWYLTELIHQDREGKSIFHGRKWRLEHATERQPNSEMQFCRFRRYPLHRYYKIDVPKDQQPDFLVAPSVEYIYGQWPKLLHLSDDPERQSKLCVDQTEWLSLPSEKTSNTPQAWPFADGTNPSVLLFQRIHDEAPKVHQALVRAFPQAYYLVTVCMTNSQCTWKDDASNLEKYDLPLLQQKQPNTVRTILQILDAKFQKLAETTIYLQRDAPWGKRVKKAANGEDANYLPALDDARLFLYGGQVFVSYREGPGFGYEAQVLNPIHFQRSTETTSRLSATILASETSSFCCGRNMALLNARGSKSLAALTWVDPVTVERVDTTPIASAQNKAKAAPRFQRRRRLTASMNKASVAARVIPKFAARNRQLGETPRKSHIHGTNGFMVPMPGNEYLGVAHFHRPSDRKPNPYARFGHHYTHAFYTVAAKSPDALDFRLTSLSQEFVLPSIHQPGDGEIIQFISGLEYDARTEEVILSYGINDCEGAIRTIPRAMVQEMLRPVPSEGQQVEDFMLPLRANG
jgi:hypothetical protein